MSGVLRFLQVPECKSVCMCCVRGCVLICVFRRVSKDTFGHGASAQLLRRYPKCLYGPKMSILPV